MTVTRVWSKRGGGNNPPMTPTLFVAKGDRIAADVYCGKLQFVGQNGGESEYKVIASGYVWVYTTDCVDTVESGFLFTCVPSQTLIVQGCHAFGCV
jgi:hypothetical protein